MFPEIERYFQGISSNVQLVVFQVPCGYKNYIFVDCRTVDQAILIRDTIRDKKPQLLKRSALPPYICFAEKIPLNENPTKLQGLTVIQNAIDSETEDALFRFINSTEPSEVLRNRTVLHFGHAFNYSTNSAFSPSIRPIPKILEDLLEKFRTSGHNVKSGYDQVTINIYEPGQGIPLHVDTHSAFENQIVIVNLLADIVMKYKDCANAATSVDVLMPRKGLVLMEGLARYKYKHGIYNRTYDVSPIDNRLIKREKRISITYRKIRSEPCECDFPEYCDWDRNGTMSRPGGDERAKELETKYVYNVYEGIADHFDLTRFSRWPAFSNFLASFPLWSVLVDAGCGNGKYLIGDDKLFRIGVDMCDGLLTLAYGKGCNVLRGDLLELPFRQDSVDGCLCAAVIHHFSTPQRRLRVFENICRILKVGGRALVSAWAMEQTNSSYEKMRRNKTIEDGEEDAEEQHLNLAIDRLTVHDGTQFTSQDMLVPWESGKKDTDEFTQQLRYYHLFVEGELDELVAQLPGCERLQSFYHQGNWFIEFRKVA